MKHDPVNNPKHYTNHPSGIECIQVTEHMGFCLGNAVKYIWRADLKHDAIEDLKKAVWYIQREIAKREGKDEQILADYRMGSCGSSGRIPCTSRTYSGESND